MYFNPHSRKGSDAYPYGSTLKITISIHTPARGVTNARQKPVHFIVYFNPHSRKGSDNVYIRTTTKEKDFNPHSRKGSDSIVHSSPYQETNFNPHSRKGSDATKQ